MATATTENVNEDDFGPIQEYDRRVAEGRLKNDEHQRGNFPFPNETVVDLARMH